MCFALKKLPELEMKTSWQWFKKTCWQRQPPKSNGDGKKMAVCRTNSRCSSEHFSIEKSILVGPPLRNHLVSLCPKPYDTTCNLSNQTCAKTPDLVHSLSLSTWSNAAISNAPPIPPIALPDTKRPKQKGGPTSDLKQIDFPILDGRFVFNTGNPEILTTESNQPKTPQTIRNPCVFWMPAWRFWIANPKSRNLNPESKFHPCYSINNPIPSKLRSTCHLKYLWISNCDDVHLRCLFEAIWNGKKWEPTQHVVSTFILHFILNLYGGIVRKFLLRQCWIK